MARRFIVVLLRAFAPKFEADSSDFLGCSEVSPPFVAARRQSGAGVAFLGGSCLFFLGIWAQSSRQVLHQVDPVAGQVDQRSARPCSIRESCEAASIRGRDRTTGASPGSLRVSPGTPRGSRTERRRIIDRYAAEQMTGERA